MENYSGDYDKELAEILAMLDSVYPLNYEDNSNDYDEYSNNIDENNKIIDNEDIGGHNPKRFVRYKSEKIKDMFSSIRNGGSYETYLNDIIKYYSDEYCPIEYVSVLRKICETKLIGVREEFASRIANLLGFKTAYNNFINKDEVHSDYTIPTVVISADFIKDNEINMTLKDFGISDWEGGNDFFLTVRQNPSLPCCVETLKNALDKNIHSEKKEDMISKIIEDFIESYFIKYVILGDTDFRPRNVGLIKNTLTGEHKLAPNYDYEQCFSNDTVLVTQNIWRDISFVYQNYPKTFKSLMNKLNRIKNLDDIKHEVSYLRQYGKVITDMYVDFVSYRINELNKCLKYFDSKIKTC